MSIRTKVLFAIVGVFVAFVILSAFIQWSILYPHFLNLERDAIQRDLRRTQETIRHELLHLGIIVVDWAEWDDTYRFVADRNEGYITSNLGNDTYIDNRVNIVAVYDDSGQAIWARAYDFVSDTDLPLENILPQQLPANSPLLRLRDRAPHVGILQVAQGPVFIAARSILRSDNSGPSRGTLIMARFLDARIAASLKLTTFTNLEIIPIFDLHRSDDLRAGIPDSREAELTQIHIDDSAIYAIARERDIEGHPSLALKVWQPRAISIRGGEALIISALSLAGLGFAILLTLAVILGTAVIKPLASLKSAIVDIRATGNLAIRLDDERTDEIGILSREFNALIGNLRDLHRNLEDLVTQRTKELEEQKSLLRAAIDASPDLIFVKDRLGKYLLVNRSFAQAYGKSVEELVGMTDVELGLYHPAGEFKLWAEQDQFVLESGKDLRRPLISWVDAGGRKRWFNIVKHPLVNEKGEADTLFGYCLDITTMKAFQDQVEEKNRDLEHALSEISLHAKEMESFTSSVAQDLVTPLNRIIETLHTFSQNYDLQLDQSGRTLLTSLTASAHAMYRLVDDLNWLNRASGWRIVRQPVSLSDIARDFAAYHTMVEPEREISFEIMDGIVVNADRILMKVVLQELLENAVQFTRSQPVARIIFGCGRENGDLTCFVVDNGPGLDPGDREAIFHPFIRGTNASAEGGTGIGLATVQRIIERHGGRVWAVNELSGGARFCFTLGEKCENTE